MLIPKKLEDFIVWNLTAVGGLTHVKSSTELHGNANFDLGRRIPAKEFRDTLKNLVLRGILTEIRSERSGLEYKLAHKEVYRRYSPPVEEVKRVVSKLKTVTYVS